MNEDFISPYTGFTEKEWLQNQGWMKGLPGSGMFLGPENLTTTALPGDMARLYSRYHGDDQRQPTMPQQPAPQTPAPTTPAPTTPTTPVPATPAQTQPAQQFDVGNWVNTIRDRFQGGGGARRSAFENGQQQGQGWQGFQGQGWGDFLSRFRRQ